MKKVNKTTTEKLSDATYYGINNIYKKMSKLKNVDRLDIYVYPSQKNKKLTMRGGENNYGRE